MTPDLWLRCQGRVVAGVGPLGELLGSSAESAVYAVESPDGPPAVVKLRKDESLASGGAPGPSPWLARWRAAQSLQHPHLIRLYSAGSCTIEGVPMVYAVMERADETLAGALADRLLSETETREMLAPALQALGYLHRDGYAHTSLKPSNVMACGDQLKLSCDNVVRVASRAKRQEDIRELGLLLAGVLTRDLPGPDEQTGSWNLRGVPEPFHRIIRHCLEPNPEKRWTLGQIEAELNPVSAPPLSPAPQLPEETLATGGLDWSRLRPGRGTLARISLAVLVLLAIVAGLRRANRPAAASGPPPDSASPPALASRAIPDAPAATPPPPPAPVARRALAERPTGSWAVVVATYAARTAAEKRASSLSRRWPRFRAEVFQPPAERPHHLVVIGRNLSEDEAAALRRRAIASGLPRDTYIRRFPG